MTRNFLVGLVWVAVLAVLGILYLTLQVSPDQALFDYIAWSHLQGDTYYAGVAEQNWPGKMFMHELGIRLFGVHFWTFRAIDFLLLLIITGGSAALLKRSGYTLGACAFLFLYPALYISSGTWMAGQRDIVAAGILLLAALSVFRPVVQQKVISSIAAGGLIAIAVLIRPTYLSFLAGLSFLVWIRLPGEEGVSLKRRCQLSLALVGGFAFPILIVILAGASVGALDDFYQQTFLFNLQAYQIPEPRSRLFSQLFVVIGGSWHWIFFLAVIGLGIWIIQKGPLRVLVLILGVAGTVMVSYFAQNKGFEYHLGGLLPVLVLFAAVAIDRLSHLRNAAVELKQRRLITGVLCMVILLCAAGVSKKISSYRASISDLLAGDMHPRNQPVKDRTDWQEISQSVRLIKAETTSQDFVLQWGRNFHVPFLAERRSSIRFVSTPGLSAMGPGFALYEQWLHEVENSLRSKPPRFAILDSKSVVIDEDAARVFPLAEAGPAEQMVISYLANYVVVQKSSHLVVLKQR